LKLRLSKAATGSISVPQAGQLIAAAAATAIKNVCIAVARDVSLKFEPSTLLMEGKVSSVLRYSMLYWQD
jgi:hypothetical protein